MRQDLEKLEEVVSKLGGTKSSVIAEKKAIQKILSKLRSKIAAEERQQLRNRKRVEEILNVVIAIAAFDYTAKAKIKSRGDDFDALANGINMLGEELESSTISLHEKEVLLKEIHHRVKNNLQVISSLLSLQSASITDPFSLEKFNESLNRIRSMAMVHEKLYQGSDLSRIDMSEYIISLVNYLNSVYNHSDLKVEISVHVDLKSPTIRIEEAVPCGLIINELVTNAFKYAFLRKKKGALYVGFEERQTGKKQDSYLLEVRDDGQGLPLDIDVDTTGTLGLQLVSLLTEQIGGKLKVSRENGTSFQIRFSLDSSDHQRSSNA
jgi:two-component sensor histidine kinase